MHIMCQKLKTNIIIIIIIFPIYINVTFLLRVILQYTIENYSIQSSEMPFSKEKISYIHTNYVVDICVRMALAQFQTTSQTRRLFCVCSGILKCRAREFYGEKPIKSMTDILYYYYYHRTYKSIGLCRRSEECFDTKYKM